MNNVIKIVKTVNKARLQALHRWLFRALNDELDCQYGPSASQWGWGEVGFYSLSMNMVNPTLKLKIQSGWN